MFTMIVNIGTNDAAGFGWSNNWTSTRLRLTRRAVRRSTASRDFFVIPKPDDGLTGTNYSRDGDGKKAALHYRRRP